MRKEIVIAALLDDERLDLDEFARACAVRREWVIEHVREGLLAAPNEAQEHWRFDSRDLRRARQIMRFERDFDAIPELAALVADLLEELAAMRAQLARSRLR